MSTCEYTRGTVHSTDLIQVNAGHSTPVTLCGFHAQEAFLAEAVTFVGGQRRLQGNQPLARVEDLHRGDRVLVGVDTRVYEMTVSFVYTDQSIAQANSLTAVAHIRPGGYSVTLRNDNLAKHDVRRLA